MNLQKVAIFLTIGVIASSCTFCEEKAVSSEETRFFFKAVSEVQQALEQKDFGRAIETYNEVAKKVSSYQVVIHYEVATIHLDYLQDYKKAVENYARVLSISETNRLEELSRTIAMKWVARISLHFLKEALDRHFAREVEYPASLKDLRAKGYVDGKHVADESWTDYVYEAKPSQLFPNLQKQEYSLYNRNLGRETKPLSVMIEERKDLRRSFFLDGLLAGAGETVAIIRYAPPSSSGEPLTSMLREGERIGDAQVVEIEGTGAILQLENDIIVLATRTREGIN